MRARSRGQTPAQTAAFACRYAGSAQYCAYAGDWAGSWSDKDMANWSDPRPTVTAAAAPVGSRAEGIDAGLRGYMLSVYNYMASGVLLTGIVALAMVMTGAVYNLFNPATGGASALGWIVMLAPFALVMVLSFGQNRLSEGTAKALYWAYAALMGASLSTMLLVYTGTSVAQVL